MRNIEPFHEGELFVQRRANEVKIAQRNSGVIADTILKGALGFIGQQPLAVFGSLDADGKVWASVLDQYGRSTTRFSTNLLTPTKEDRPCKQKPISH